MRFFILLSLTISLTSIAFSQNPTPTPNDDVVRISTNLIQLDVTVTDSKGRVVRDLKAADFEVFENGEKQEITNFSFVSSVREIVSKPISDDKSAVPLPTTVLRSDQVRRTIALVVDDLSLSFQSAYYVRRALKKFVDEQMQDGDLVAIIRTGAGIGALQQFTSDRRQLYAAIEKVKWNPLGRGGVGAFAPINDSPSAQQSETSEEDRQAQENFENSFDDFRGSIFATGTLGALRYIVTGMGELPGRKSVILFSDGFRLLERDSSGYEGAGRVMDFMGQLIETANRNSVVFYTIDGRGLQTTNITAEDNVTATPERIQQVLSNRSSELYETQQGLSYLARETGGFSIQNNNDLSGGVQRVLDDQSYYLIAYQPDSDTFDPKTRRFNKIEIKVKQKNVDVRYRSGFFNFAQREIRPEFASVSPQEQIERALVLPFAVNDISLHLNALFGNNQALGTFVRPLLHVNAGDLKFEPQPDGSKKAVFAVLAMLFGDNGMVVDQVSRTYTLTVRDDVFESIQKHGFVYHFSIPIKKPGAYQMRVAIRDSTSGKVGAASQFVEVPNLKKERLTLSAIVLENLNESQWNSLFSANSNQSAATGGTVAHRADPMTDTSVRKFRRGSILRYGVEVYNAKSGPSKQTDLSIQVRVVHDGKIVMTGQKLPVNVAGQTDFERIKVGGALNLVTGMRPGDYILQIIVTDNLAKEKRRVSTQFIQFEVTD